MFLPVKYLFIKNQNLPTCVNCKHYQIPVKYYKDGKIYNINGKCSIFGEKNLETGELIYNDSLDCRLNDRLCTTKAIYFEQIEEIEQIE